ncbi:DUF6766 family protein [Pseudaminobacter sp. NGMCC 1.201702]|uniref:DUF6766 family protein n=1 Tax=Pseudaminobacter sp. NGMCC 1.201702 TaxID=3391825 RepID=UPI0039F05A8A
MKNGSIWRSYSYAWITLAFFVLTIVGHWVFGWFAFVSEQQSHGEAATFGPYVVEMARDTLENWQSEFLQLLWQVGGLAFLLFLGSPQSREGSDRLEAKVDELLKQLNPERADQLIDEIDERYSGRHTDIPHAHR